MNEDIVIQVILRLRDEMGDQAKKCLETVARGFETAGRAAMTMARETDRAARSEGHLAREAGQVTRATDQMARAGNRLATALGKVGRAGNTARKAMRGIGKVGSGMAKWLRAPIDYGKKINEMSNTAFYAQGGDRVKLGKAELRKTIKDAARRGGDNGQLAEAMQDLLYSGMGYDKAKSILPEVAYASSAAFADPKDFANVAITAEKQKLIEARETGKLFAMMFKGGQLGKFAVKDMARFMPGIMSQAQGMRGREGAASLIAAAQVTRDGSSTNGEAATNLTNLLKTLTSQDPQRHFAKFMGVDLNKAMVRERSRGMNPLDAFVQLMEKEVFGKDKTVLDAQKRLEKAKGTGKEDDARQALALARKGAMGKVIVGIDDKRAALSMVDGWDEYKRIKKDVLAADGSSMQVAHRSNEQELWYKWEQVSNRFNTAMDSLTERLKGGLGALADGVIQLVDKFPPLAEAAVAATAALGILGLGRVGLAALKVVTGGGAATVAAGRGIGTTVVGMAKDGLGMLKGAGGWLFGAARGIGTTVAGMAKDGLGMLKGAGGWLFGAARGMGTRVAGMAKGGLGMLKGAGGWLSGAARGMLPAVKDTPWLVGVMAAWDLYRTEKDASLTRAQKNIAHIKTHGETAGALAGMAMGAAVGSVVPLLGTAAGGFLGTLIGWWAGGRAGEGAGQMLYGGSAKPDPGVVAAAHQLAAAHRETIKFESVLHVDGREMARVVNDYNRAESLRD